MGATIGLREEDLFKPYTLEIRKSHVDKVYNFMISLPSNLSEKNCHARKLKFMAECRWDTAVRSPWIGIFADRQRPLSLSIVKLMHGSINFIKHH